MTERRPLAALIDPASMAIIGASSDPDRIGGRPIAYSRRYGFRGAIYPINPINPTRQRVQRLQAYPDLESLPEVPDVAMIIVPGLLAVEAVEACAAAGVRAVVVAASGFAEAGGEGIGRLRVAPLLAGGNRMGPVDLSSFVDAVLGVGRALTDLHSGIVEIEVNPVMVGRDGEGSLAVDALVVVQDNGDL